MGCLTFSTNAPKDRYQLVVVIFLVLCMLLEESDKLTGRTNGA